MKYSSIFAVVVLTVAITGCSQSGNDESAEKSQAATSKDPHAGLDMSGNAPVGSGSPILAGGNRGTITEVLQAGNYTYVSVDMTGGKKLWLASNQADVKLGQQIAWRDGALMRNFNSKALNRQFEAVMFVSGFLPPDSQPQPTGNIGVVLTVMESAGYSYLEVDTEKGKQWLALPTKNIKEGDRIRWSGGSLMQNFHSKSLNRDFDQIWFIGGADIIG